MASLDLFSSCLDLLSIVTEIKINGEVLQGSDAVKCDVGGTVGVLCTVKNNIGKLEAGEGVGFKMKLCFKKKSSPNPIIPQNNSVPRLVRYG